MQSCEGTGRRNSKKHRFLAINFQIFKMKVSKFKQCRIKYVSYLLFGDTTMKRLVILCAFMLLSYPIWASDENGIVGKWRDHKGEAIVEIYKKGDKFFGRLCWLKEPYDKKGCVRKDLNNPEIAKRNRELEGIEILHNFSYDEDGVWTGGKIYDPRSGKTYDCKLSLHGSDKLYIRGFIGFSLIGKTETMVRMN